LSPDHFLVFKATRRLDQRAPNAILNDFVGGGYRQRGELIDRDDRICRSIGRPSGCFRLTAVGQVLPANDRWSPNLPFTIDQAVRLLDIGTCRSIAIKLMTRSRREAGHWSATASEDPEWRLPTPC
jgi:hypothetical protein